MEAVLSECPSSALAQLLPPLGDLPWPKQYLLFSCCQFAMYLCELWLFIVVVCGQAVILRRAHKCLIPVTRIGDITWFIAANNLLLLPSTYFCLPCVEDVSCWGMLEMEWLANTPCCAPHERYRPFGTPCHLDVRALCRRFIHWGRCAVIHFRIYLCHIYILRCQCSSPLMYPYFYRGGISPPDPKLLPPLWHTWSIDFPLRGFVSYIL